MRRWSRLATLIALAGAPLVAAATPRQSTAPAWPADGPKRLWSVPLCSTKGSFSAPVPVDGKLYVLGRNGSKDVVKCLAADSGKPIWSLEYEAPGSASYGAGPRARPVVAEGRVYTSNAFDHVYCLDAETGAPVWDRDLGKELKPIRLNFGASAAPLPVDELLICQPGASKAGACVVALDRKTGKDVWKCAEGSGSYAAPQVATIGGTRQIVLFTSLVAGLDLKTGRVLWSYPYNDGKNVGAPVILDDQVITGNLSWGLGCRRIARAGDTWTAEKVWSAPDVRICSFSPVLEDGHLYLFDDQANVTCVNARTGKVTWSLPTRPHKMEEHANALLVAPHRLLLNFEDGLVVLYEVSSSAGRELARFKAVDGPYAMSPAALEGGRLFVRDQLVLSCFRWSGD